MTELNPKLKELRAKAMALPLQPGVYLMHDKSDKIKEMFKSSAVPARMGALSEDERKLIALFRLADTSGKVKILKDISKNIKQK